MLDVPQLVGHHQLRLVRLGGAQQGVVRDDPAGRAEAGDVRVERGRAARGVGDQDVLHPDRVALGEGEQGAAQRARPHRGEAVEHRLHQQRVEEGERDDQQRGHPGGGQPPALRGPLGERVQPVDGGEGERQRQREAAQDVQRPAPPALGDQAVSAADRPDPGREGQPGRLAEQDQHRRPAQHFGRPRAAEQPAGPRHQPGPGRGEPEHEGEQQPGRLPAERPRHLRAAQRPSPGHLFGGEVGAGVRAEVVHAPQSPVRADARRSWAGPAGVRLQLGADQTWPAFSRAEQQVLTIRRVTTYGSTFAFGRRSSM